MRLEALAYVEAVALSSDAVHIITPSKSGPRRALQRAYETAGITREDVGIIDLNATGTPGNLNELDLVDELSSDRTFITARKGQLGHGMANSGRGSSPRWEWVSASESPFPWASQKRNYILEYADAVSWWERNPAASRPTWA